MQFSPTVQKAKGITIESEASVPFELLAGRRLFGGLEYEQIADRLFAPDNPLRVFLFASVFARREGSQVVRTLAGILAARGARFIVLDGALRVVIRSSESDAAAERELWTVLGSVSDETRMPVAAVIERLRAHYDYVLVDCGAIESSFHVPCLITASDGVVLLVEAGVTEKSQLTRAVESILAMQGRVVGFIMTRYSDPLPGWIRRLLPS